MTLAQLDRPVITARHPRTASAVSAAPAEPVRPVARGAQTPTAAQQARAAALSGSISAAPPLKAPAVSRQPGPAAPSADEAPAAPRIRAVPSGTKARGFVLYVGIDEEKAGVDGVSLGQLVEALKRLTAEVAPSAETYAAVALAPEGAGGRDVDVVRLALQDPAALAEHRKREEEPEEDTRPGVVIDITRKRLTVDGENAGLTYKEFELLQYLVLREGQTIERTQLISGLWPAGSDDEAPNERTIDVHVRRLRAKLGYYEDIVRTVRGAGYRFDRHADVSIHYASAPSPDFF